MPGIAKSPPDILTLDDSFRLRFEVMELELDLAPVEDLGCSEDRSLRFGVISGRTERMTGSAGVLRKCDKVRPLWVFEGRILGAEENRADC